MSNRRFENRIIFMPLRPYEVLLSERTLLWKKRQPYYGDQPSKDFLSKPLRDPLQPRMYIGQKCEWQYRLSISAWDFPLCHGPVESLISRQNYTSVPVNSEQYCLPCQ